MGPRPGRTRTAIDRVGRGRDRHVNMRFLAMANHYVFEPVFCDAAAGWEEGQIEKKVQDPLRDAVNVPLARRLWKPSRAFPILLRWMTGWNSAASRCGTRSRMQHCPGVLLTSGPQSRPR